MVKNVFQQFFKPRTKLPRNAFDLSNRLVTSMPCGMILPFMVREVNPGELIKSSIVNETRTIQMASFNFQRFKQHFDYYFIPYRLLWRWWPQFIAQTTDYNTAFAASPTTLGIGSAAPAPPTEVPFAKLAIILNSLSSTQDYNSDLSGHFFNDQMGYPIWKGFQRLGNLLGIGNVPSPNPGGNFTSTSTINLFRFAAYQKIYYDWYRNTDYEYDVPAAYNLDKFNAPYGGQTPTAKNLAHEMFMVRYALLQRDQVTTITPSQYYVGIGTTTPVAGVNEVKVPLYAGMNRQIDVYGSPIVPWGTNNKPGQPIGPGNQGVVQNEVTTGYTSAADIRMMFALERMSMISQRAAKRYSSQMAARFNESVPQHDDLRCYRVGSYENVVGVQEVTSTADSGNNALGSLGAKGVGKSGKNGFSYQPHEHGIFMGITYIEPLVDYTSDYIDSFNQKFNRNDYYQPEFDNIGMQPLYGHNVSLTNGDNKLVGYQPRYLEYKSSRDIVDQYFAQAFPSWSCPRDVLDFTTGSMDNFFSFYRWLHISPNIADPIFFAKFNGDYSTDQFLCNFFNSVQIVRNMSVDGMPRL